MSNETSFLRAIADDPERDGPRLVFADWLTERGDPRGELIRLQVELARPGPQLPDHEVRVAALVAGQQERLRALNLAHGASWDRGVLQVGTTFEEFQAAAG